MVKFTVAQQTHASSWVLLVVDIYTVNINDVCYRFGFGLAVLSVSLLCLKFRNQKFVKFEFSISDLSLDPKS